MLSRAREPSKAVLQQNPSSIPPNIYLKFNSKKNFLRGRASQRNLLPEEIEVRLLIDVTDRKESQRAT